MSRELKIERNLVLKTMVQLEDITKKPMCDTHPDLEKQIMDKYWGNEKYLRQARFNLEQIVDDLNMGVKHD